MDNREPGVYRCPVCQKPFDVSNKWANYAISAHEKSHEPSRNTAEGLLRMGDNDVWCCMLCGHPFVKSQAYSRLSMIDHARDAHGSLPASSAPVATRGGGGRVRRSSFGSKRDVGDTVGDALETVGKFLGKVFGND